MKGKCGRANGPTVTHFSDLLSALHNSTPSPWPSHVRRDTLPVRINPQIKRPVPEISSLGQVSSDYTTIALLDQKK